MPPVDANRSDPNRRRVLAAGLAGITSTVLPAATAAASDVQVPQGFEAPTGVTAVPIGYVSGGSTGEIRVSWNVVTGATGYEVARTFDGTTETVTVVGGATATTDLIGLDGVDGTHAVVVRALAGSTRSEDSLEASTSAVIADGGVVTTIAGTPTYVLHTFAYDAGSPTATLTLRRTIDLEYLLVGGGGGGGAGYMPSYKHAGGGGGGGGVATGLIDDAVGEFVITVGGGGAGLLPDGNDYIAGSGGNTTLTDGVAEIVAGGGGGGQRGLRDNGNPLGGAGGPSGAPTVFSSLDRVLLHGTGGSGSGQVGSTGSGGGGAGGAGASSSITGSAVVYGGGGGGGTPNGTSGTGGSGGGGTGGRNNGTGTSQASPTAGTDGRGGGGGGGNSGDGSTVSSRTGARGGHGVAVVRYALP